MIKFILVLIAGYVIGQIHAYRKHRKQCLNCGGYNTEQISSGLGGGGGEYKFAVVHWEGHRCKDCEKYMSVQIKLNK